MPSSSTPVSSTTVSSTLVSSTVVCLLIIFTSTFSSKSYSTFLLLFSVVSHIQLKFNVELMCYEIYYWLYIYTYIHTYTRLKNIKNVKRCRDGMPKSMQTR